MKAYFEEQDALAENKELQNEWNGEGDTYHKAQDAIAERKARKQDLEWLRAYIRNID